MKSRSIDLELLSDSSQRSRMESPGAAPPSLEHCLEVFAKGVAFTRSHSSTYIASKIRGVWWLRDMPNSRARPRNQEWIVDSKTKPNRVDEMAREAAERFLIDAIATSKEEEIDLLSEYRKLGYRLWQRQQLMLRPLLTVPPVETDAKIHFVGTEEMASRLAKEAGEKMHRETREDGISTATRCHIATVERQLVGWVRSVSIGKSSWCSSLFVKPEFRRRGIARALVRAMLLADEKAEANASILVATQAGEKVYSAVGYRHIGTVMVLTPIK